MFSFWKSKKEEKELKLSKLKMAKETKKISKEEFKADVANGMTRSELKEKYGIAVSNINAIAKQLEVEIRREVKPVFELI